MRQEEHVARMGSKKMHTKFQWEILTVRNPFGDTSVYTMIILKCILTKQDLRVWTEFNWLKRVPSDGLL